MNFCISSIKWPLNRTVSLHLVLEFQIKALRMLNVEFENTVNDPLKITIDYMGGMISDSERKVAVVEWWTFLDDKGAVRDFQSKDALMARLAICLLSVEEKDFLEFGEHLSWFLEVLGFLGFDLSHVISMMETYFSVSDEHENS